MNKTGFVPYTLEQMRERFWARVDKSGGRDACWPWTATRLPQGYGLVQCTFAGLKYPAGTHRVAYWLTHGGTFPKDPVCVLHSCDNPSCCNPKHLRLGDRLENMADKMARGRQHVYHNPCYKLKPADVRFIHVHYRRVGNHSNSKELAKRFGVSPAAITAIAAGRSWTHITGLPSARRKAVCAASKNDER